jgi:hypothetical protein
VRSPLTSNGDPTVKWLPRLSSIPDLRAVDFSNRWEWNVSGGVGHQSVYRKSIDKLYQMLTLMEGPTAATDRARLSSLGPKDKYLALTKPHYDNIRANITYSRLDSRGRVQLAAELPPLYTAGRWPTPPEVHYPAPAEELGDQPRRKRQSSLESEPSLQSIRAYRYVHG